MSRRGVKREQTSVTLEDSQMEEFKAAFQLFSGGKERLNAEDLDRALKKFAIKGGVSAKDMIKEADTTGEGSIDFMGFSNLMSRKFAQSDTEADLRDAFEKYDWGRSGLIKADELVADLTNLGKPISTREVQEFLAVCKEGDNVNYNKFLQVMYGKKAE